MGKKNRANKRQKREGSAAKEAAVLVEQEETVKKVEENKKQQQKKKQKQQKQKRPVEEDKEDVQEEARQPIEKEADKDDHNQVQPNDDGEGEGDIEEKETSGANDDDEHENVIKSQPSVEAKPEPPFVSDGKYRNKQRCLLLSSRGITARYRHLMEDLRTLIPHHKKDSKLDAGDEGPGNAVNAIAEMRGCNTVLFLECRKRQDAYMWMGRVGATAGPSARFHVTNIHTMDELRLTGNCMKGSRPVLSFDQAFDNFAHLRLLKALLVDVFGTPRGHPKSKPFVDRVMAFYHADNKIWVRNYQILEKQATNAKEAHEAKKESGQSAATSLVEIGPRFVLTPIRIFRGSFGGQTLYKNDAYVSPNETRALENKGKSNAYVQRKRSQKKRKAREEMFVLPEDPLDSVFR